jgi:hypothetical protein
MTSPAMLGLPLSGDPEIRSKGCVLITTEWWRMVAVGFSPRFGTMGGCVAERHRNAHVRSAPADSCVALRHSPLLTYRDRGRKPTGTVLDRDAVNPHVLEYGG